MARQNKAERQARLRVAPEPTEEKPATRDELYAAAKSYGIKGASRFNRDQLIEAIAAHQEADGVGSTEPEATPPDVSTMAGRQALGDQRVAEAAAHYAETKDDPDAPKAEEDPAKRTIAAKGEQAALKEWQLAGAKGERPATPNYDYIAAAYLNGGQAPKAKRSRSGGGGTRAKSGGPRRAEADAAKAALGGKRGAGVKISDDDLRTYIRDVHREHPESSRSDEREYAYWVEKLSLTGRWPAFWKEVVEGEEPAPTESDATPPPKKAAPAKRAPAKSNGAAKQVEPNFKGGAKSKAKSK